MVSVSFADVIIGDWEGTGDDGWSVSDGGVYPQQTVGVTLGQYSGGFDIPFHVAGEPYWNVSKSVNVADLVGATAVTMDLTLIATEWQTYWNFLLVDKMSVQSDSTVNGWQEFNVAWTDRVTGLPLGGIGWGPWSPDALVTLTWNLTGLDLTGATYANLNFAFENPKYRATGLFYVDNARIVTVPEPATMGLLGLGGLALIRRKK
jgi:hypothetical protein